MRDPRLCINNESGARVAHAENCGRRIANDAGARSPLRALYQWDVSAFWHTLGGAISLISGRYGQILAGLQSIHRDETSARGDGGGTWRLPLLELCVERTW